MATAYDPIPGRECGNCNACCVALTIKDEALRKPQGIRCTHNQPDGRCGIYETRPQTCRAFYCGWRLLKWVKPGLRPDQSGVMVKLTRAGRGHEVEFMILEEAGLAAEGLAESVAAAIAAQLPVILIVPGPPGYTSGFGQVNDVLAEAVRTRNKPELLRILRQVWEAGRFGDHERIVLD